MQAESPREIATMLDRPRNASLLRHHTMHVPRTMFAAAIDRFGGPEVITGHALPVPPLDPDEVMIAVDTAGVGRWDADVREGFYAPRKPHFPLVLGYDGSGIVAAVGSRVRRLKAGDEVYSYNWENPKGGFYAEYVAVPADKVAPIPKRLDLRHAGAIPITGLTALQGIDDALKLKKGETIIIHAASGGVGTLAVQFARLRGARVFATASGLDGVELVREMGAHVTIDGKRVDIDDQARRFAPDGADAILALAGGDALEKCMNVLRPGGRLAHPNGIEPAPKKRRGMELIRYDGISGVREFERLNAAVQAAKLKVAIAECYSLAHAYKAHERLAEGHVVGKIILSIHASYAKMLGQDVAGPSSPIRGNFVPGVARPIDENFSAVNWNARHRPELGVMKRFYFHRYLNGNLAADRRGRQFESADEACAHAVRRTPAVLQESVRPTTNIHLATEVSDGKRIFCIVRGKVIIERR
jgi:NADPH:quinone reductase-like Zn-dependent oxidoreductase